MLGLQIDILVCTEWKLGCMKREGKVSLISVWIWKYAVPVDEGEETKRKLMAQCECALYCQHSVSVHRSAITVWVCTVLPSQCECALDCHHSVSVHCTAITVWVCTVLPSQCECAPYCHHSVSVHWTAIRVWVCTVLPSQCECALECTVLPSQCECALECTVLPSQCECALECTVLPSAAYRKQSAPENQTVCSRTLTGVHFTLL